jgi:hypothetical protein
VRAERVRVREALAVAARERGALGQGAKPVVDRAEDRLTGRS